MGSFISLKQDLCFSAVIFDMDGLVLDTEASYFIAWQQAAAQMGYVLSDEFCLTLSGLHYQHVEQRLKELCGVDFDLQQFNRLSGDYWFQFVRQQGISVKKGFFNLLKMLRSKKIPFALATNSGRANALECLEFANIQTVFSTIVTRDDVKRGKPDPDVFLLAAKLLNVPITQTVVIEDSLTGVQAASLSGAYSVFIPSVLPVDKIAVDIADYFLNDLDELAQFINQK